MYTLFNNDLLHTLGLWHWHDLVEVIFFSSIFYAIGRWLLRHTTKRLFLFFYGYLGALILASVFAFTNIYSLMAIAVPIAFMLMMLKHHELLQKHFVTPKNLVPAHREANWIEAIIQTSLIAFNENRSLCYVIQCQNDPSGYIHSSILLQELVYKDLLCMLTQSSVFNEKKFIWIQSDGKLRAVNCEWNQALERFLPADHSKNKTDFEKTALVMTAKTDAIAIQSNALARTFTIIVRGTVVEHLSAHQCIESITKYISDITNKPKGIPREKKYDQKNDRQSAA